MNRRIAALTSRPPVQGRVIAVLTDTSTDEDGHTSTSHTPVITFTTQEGITVTAYCTEGLPDPANSHGISVAIHYTPDDPAVFTPTSRRNTGPAHSTPPAVSWRSCWVWRRSSSARCWCDAR
ncbi:hypothetical protein AB0G86_30050 [Streptomyces scabiei]|uniref:hypothetical protein n=1 Tax=Streptomyces scabiei TaxID=1930 RepID=UPI0033E69B61